MVLWLESLKLNICFTKIGQKLDKKQDRALSLHYGAMYQRHDVDNNKAARQ